MPKREGPGVGARATCHDCNYCETESYRVQSDSGHDVYCNHPEVVAAMEAKPHGERRYVDDTGWRTPKWCPLLPQAVARLVQALQADPTSAA